MHAELGETEKRVNHTTWLPTYIQNAGNELSYRQNTYYTVEPGYIDSEGDHEKVRYIGNSIDEINI